MFVSTKLQIITDETGADIEIPGLMTPAGVLMPLVDYFVSRYHDRSLPWMDKIVRSTQIFLEYLQANPRQLDSHLLFSNFAQRLYDGTFDEKTGYDPSGLCWMPRSVYDARRIITDLSQFFVWMGEENRIATNINPLVRASAFDRLWAEISRQYRRDSELLGHLWCDSNNTEMVRRVMPRRVPGVVKAEPPAFPEEKFIDLIVNGFKVGNRYNYRAILITLLQHGAGFRASEPFQLYIEDVVPDPRNPRMALVRIHHPSEGFAPSGWRDAFGRPRKGNRANYLVEKYGLVPRKQLLGSQRAGWKGGLHDGKFYKNAYWFQPEYGELFLTIWHKYLHQVACVDRTHPFAFINLSREPLGGIYTMTQYVKAHAAACRRIGLEVRKSLGTTPHGHRHAYGRRLAQAGLNKSLIRRLMHHFSEESQEVYTQPTLSEIGEELERAARKLGMAVPNSASQVFNNGSEI